MVKGLYVLNKDQEPPRVHNIWSVFDRIYEIDKMDKEFIEATEKYFPFFDELLAYYISERYPSYKEMLSDSIDKSKATEVLEKSKEVFLWLKSLKM